MDEEKYRRLAERLKEPVPKGRIEWAHELAMDLAVGFDEGAWGNLLRGGTNIPWQIVTECDDEAYKLLEEKWSRIDFSDWGNLEEQGYLRKVSDKYLYQLTKKATDLGIHPNFSPTIFISYKHGTCAPLAKLIATQIACKTNAKPFLDESREVSEDLDEGFEQEIERCVAFIGVLRSDSLSKDSYVREEIKMAEGANKQLAFIWHDGYSSEEPDGQAPDELKTQIDGLVAIPVEGKSAGAYSHAIEKLLRELCNNNEYLCYEYNPDWLE